MRAVVVAAVVGLAIAAAAFGSERAPAGGAAPVGGAAAARQLRCSGSEIMVVIAHVGPRSGTARSVTPSEALERFLRRFPPLDPGDFSAVARTARRIQWAAADDGERVASALVSRNGGRAVVSSFAACDHVLEGGR